MPLHPDAAAALARMKENGWVPRRTLTPDGARRQSETQQDRLRASTPEIPVYAVEEWMMPATFGSIPLRVYRSGPGVLPIVMFFHGGGWVLGDRRMSETPLRRLCNAVGCLVVSVEYRLAPEAPFPAGFEDCLAATEWVVANAALLNGDPSRVAVSGVSAGGNLAAAVCLAARDRGGPEILHQLLVCPALDIDFDRPSYISNAEGLQLERGDMIWFWQHYLGDLERPHSPYALPLRAESLQDLPSAHIVVAEFDPLRDEGAEYAARLASAGVQVCFRCCPGMVHGVLGSPIPAGRLAFDEASRLLQSAFSLS